MERRGGEQRRIVGLARAANVLLLRDYAAMASNRGSPEALDKLGVTGSSPVPPMQNPCDSAISVAGSDDGGGVVATPGARATLSTALQPAVELKAGRVRAIKPL